MKYPEDSTVVTMCADTWVATMIRYDSRGFNIGEPVPGIRHAGSFIDLRSLEELIAEYKQKMSDMDDDLGFIRKPTYEELDQIIKDLKSGKL